MLARAVGHRTALPIAIFVVCAGVYVAKAPRLADTERLGCSVPGTTPSCTARSQRDSKSASPSSCFQRSRSSSYPLRSGWDEKTDRTSSGDLPP